MLFTAHSLGGSVASLPMLQALYVLAPLTGLLSRNLIQVTIWGKPYCLLYIPIMVT